AEVDVREKIGGDSATSQPLSRRGAAPAPRSDLKMELLGARTRSRRREYSALARCGVPGREDRTLAIGRKAGGLQHLSSRHLGRRIEPVERVDGRCRERTKRKSSL